MQHILDTLPELYRGVRLTAQKFNFLKTEQQHDCTGRDFKLNGNSGSNHFCWLLPTT